MSTRIEAYERCKLWPIRIEILPGRVYVTLWGDAGGPDDRLLSDSRGFLLFSTTSQMWARIAHLRGTCFAGRPGMRRLRTMLRRGVMPRGVPVGYRLHAVYLALRTFAPRFVDAATARGVVDCLNLLWDVATNLQDRNAQALLKGRAPLGRLLDVLTFYDPSTMAPPGRLRSLAPTSLAHDFATLAGLLLLNARVVD